MTMRSATRRNANSRLYALLGLALAGAATQADAQYRNTTAGGVLRPGVYGRIEIGTSAPPPLIYPKPVVASREVPLPGVRPVYLYIPPGQVRKWDKHCGKYAACDLPVYFVRMDDSPSKLGKWKARTALAAHSGVDASLRTMGGPPGSRD